ncbi:helix-turn-helix domain-containing protein [Saccharopolyspora sp. NPDC002376]
MDQPPRFLKVAQVAKALGVSEMTLYREINAKRFPAIRVGRRFAIPADVLTAMAEQAMRSWQTVNAADFVAA